MKPTRVQNGFLRRNWPTIQSLVVCLVDVGAIVISGLIAYYVRLSIRNIPIFPHDIYADLILYAALGFLVAALFMGLYRRPRVYSFHRQVSLGWKAYILGFVGMLTVLYLFWDVHLPWRFIIIFVACFFRLKPAHFFRLKLPTASKG